MLNIRPDLIEQGPPQRIAGTVRKVIMEGAGGGRFVLLINLVPTGVLVEYVHAAVAAAKRFGAYPIAEEYGVNDLPYPRIHPLREVGQERGTDGQLSRRRS